MFVDAQDPANTTISLQVRLMSLVVMLPLSTIGYSEQLEPCLTCGTMLS